MSPSKSVWYSNPRSALSPSEQPTPQPSPVTSYPMTVVSRLKVFVGGLSQTASEEEMRDYFGQFGSGVAEVEIKIDKITGRSRGFGFVTILQCDATRLFSTSHKIANKPVDVAEVTETKIVVTNIKFSTTCDQIVSHFSRYGTILSCEPAPVISSLTMTNMMTIVFEAADAASNALAEGSHFVDGVRLEVRKAEPAQRSSGASGGSGGQQRGHRNKNAGNFSAVSTTSNTPVISGVSIPPHASMHHQQQPGYGAFGGYGDFDINVYNMQAETRILPKLEYGALGAPSSYGIYPVPGYDMLPGVGTSNRYHPIGL